MVSEEPLLLAIIRQPGAAEWAVYADWLEENDGEPGFIRCIRLWCQIESFRAGEIEGPGKWSVLVHREQRELFYTSTMFLPPSSTCRRSTRCKS